MSVSLHAGLPSEEVSAALPVAELRRRIATMLDELDSSCRSLRSVQTELDDFLVQYYRRVGPWFEKLEQLHARYYGQDTVSTVPNLLMHMPSTGQGKRTLRAVDREVRALYRRLVKSCHPDASRHCGEQTAMPDIRAVNAAYGRKEIGTLWQLDWQASERRRQRQKVRKRRAELVERYDALVVTLTQLRDQEKTLRNSAAYQLMERDFVARLQSRDLAGSVIAEVKRDIAELERKLLMQG